jgi:hypothetical protein
MTLGEYIRALVTTLQECDAGAYERLCHVVGTRRASIQLDAQSVYVRMHHGILDVEDAGRERLPVEGEGSIDSATVLAILRGDLEVFEAILDDRLVVHGDLVQINRMFQAIEILLDVAPRCPAMQQLNNKFVEESLSRQMAPAFSKVNWYPFAVNAAEFAFLARYRLLA